MTEIGKYCRLCAQPTEQLILDGEEVALNSKIAKKMLWINVDVSPSNNLPKTICFSCFDLLERTWIFLHNVQEAQTKLHQIFSKTNEFEITLKNDSSEEVKPLDLDWEDFQEVKVIIKDEITIDNHAPVDTSELKQDLEKVKAERQSSDDIQNSTAETDGFITSDSELPLLKTVKKKKVKKTPEQFNKSCKKLSEKHYKKTVEQNFKCDQCCKEFKTRSNFQKHKLVHTDRSRDFSCDMCGKMFYTKETLRSHILTHKEAKPYKCKFCPMAFKASGNLQAHLSLHSGAKPFVCGQCGKSFRAERHLKSHSIMHTDLKPFICEYCNKAFRFKTRLNLHLRQHTGFKPYTCDLCQRDFTNGSNYKKHMKRQHNIDTSSRRKYMTTEQ